MVGELKIGKKILILFSYLNEKELLTREVIEELEDINYCKEKLKGRQNKFPLLLKLDTNVEERVFRKFGTKESRYYTSDKIKIRYDGNSYLLCSQLHVEDTNFLSSWSKDKFGFYLEELFSGEFVKKQILSKSKEIITDEKFQSILKYNDFHFEKSNSALKDVEQFSSDLDSEIVSNLIRDFKESKSSFSHFYETLEGDEYELFSKIAILISYIDLRGANKNELNQYEDKRTLGHTGQNQNDWCLGILNHLLKIDRYNENQELNVFERTFKYIKSPELGINIFSQGHVERLAEVFIGNNEFVFDDLLIEFKKSFSSHLGVLSNKKNETHLIASLLYDGRIRSIWDKQKADLSFLIEYIQSHRVWFYSPGENAVLWREQFAQGECSLGWDKIGHYQNYSSKNDIKNALDDKYNRKEDEAKNANTIWNFKDQLAEGDILIAKEGISKLIGIGVVQSDLYFDENIDEHKNRRKIKWLLKKKVDAPKKPGIPQAALSPVDDAIRTEEIFKKFDYELTSDDVLLIDKDTDIQNLINEEEDMLKAKNTILYGPPGTGKTYRSRSLALELIGDKADNFVERFNHLKSQKQVEFITFHQSYSYEQFVEGIIPETAEDDENNSITYNVVHGVFKRICQEALCELIIPKNDSTGGKTLPSFDLAYSQLIEEVEETPKVLKTQQGSEFTITRSTRGGMRVDVTDGGGWSIAKDTLKKVYIDLTSVKSPPYSRKDIKSVTEHSLSSYIMPIINEISTKATTSVMGEVTKYKPDEVLKYLEKGQYDINQRAKQFVIVIDEINRGNISQILGELITLIEPNKRVGGEEDILVTLPYSKDTFGVPSNLHIIGTMNTADRSVEAMDTALRRRFDFVEAMPSDETSENLVWHEFDSFNVKDLFNAMNARIEYFLGRDHTLGHFFFTNLEGDALGDLKKRFSNKIIPLLKEYFYEDWEKIGLILGSGFVNNDDGLPEFAEFDYEGDYSTKRKYTLNKVENWTEKTFLGALK